MASAASESGFVDNWQGERTLAECNLHMLTTQDGCDVHFRVGPQQETVHAHRYILISRSCVFHAMFCGPLAESETITIPDVTEGPFMEFLKFLYTDDCTLSAGNVTAVLYLSKKYAVERLQKRCLTCLLAHLTVENACVVLDQAHLFDEKNLLDKALDVIKQNGEVCLESPGFRELSKQCLDMVLTSVDLENAFQAALAWAEAKCDRTGKDPSPSNKRQVLGESIYRIGFTGFDVKMFVKSVLPTNVLCENEVIKIMSYVTCRDVDVTPFRTVSKNPPDVQSKSLDVQVLDMYTRTHITQLHEYCSVQSNDIADNFMLKADFDLILQRIVLTPNDGDYEVGIEYTTKDSQNARFVSTVAGSQIVCGILIPANTECDIKVILEEGCCPDELMTGLKSGFKIGKSAIIIERVEDSCYRTKGLVEKMWVIRVQ